MAVRDPFVPPSPRTLAIRAELMDTSWAGFVIRPAPIKMVFNDHGMLAFVGDDEGMKDVEDVSTQPGGKEIALVVSNDSAEVFSGLVQRFMEMFPRVGDPFLNAFDLGLFFEFKEYDDLPGADLYMMAFCRNIAEYQAKALADDIGIKNWMCPRAYHEDGERLPAAASKLYFLPHLGAGFVRHIGSAWDYPEHKQFKEEGWLRRSPGVLSVSVGPRLVAQKLASSRFRGQRGAELMQSCTRWLRTRSAAGSSLADTAKMLGIGNSAGDLTINFLLPLKEDK